MTAQEEQRPGTCEGDSLAVVDQLPMIREGCRTDQQPEPGKRCRNGYHLKQPVKVIRRGTGDRGPDRERDPDDWRGDPAAAGQDQTGEQGKVARDLDDVPVALNDPENGVPDALKS